MAENTKKAGIKLLGYVVSTSTPNDTKPEIIKNLILQTKF